MGGHLIEGRPHGAGEDVLRMWKLVLEEEQLAEKEEGMSVDRLEPVADRDAPQIRKNVHACGDT